MTRPSVLVLPVDNSVGLAVARALGREGVPVAGVSFSPDGFGLRSRYLTERYVIEGPKDTRMTALLKLVEERRPALLMAHGEANMAGINARRAEFEQFTKPLFATQDVLVRAFDKAATLKIAHGLGIPVPRSYSVTSPDDLPRLADTVTFPVVLKPPRQIEDPDLAHLHFAYRIISDKKGLLEFLKPYRTAPFYPLIQEYHPGHGIGIETCFYRGEPLAVFQHRRLREYPPTGGPSVYRRSEAANPQLLDWSLRLLRAMEWDGVAMVEFRYDPNTDTAVLMEVNGRFWGSLPLAIHSGVNFPHLLYLAHGLGTPQKVDVYKTGVYCRQISADTKRLWAILRNDSRQPGQHGRLTALLEYFAAFLECHKYDLEWPDDPWPALAFWSRQLRRQKTMPSMAARQLRAPTAQAESLFETTTCDDCRNVAQRILYSFGVKGEMVSIVRCAACRAVYLSPRPRKEEIGRFYPSTYYSYRQPVAPSPSKLNLKQRVRNTVTRDVFGYDTLPREMCLTLPGWLVRRLGRRVSVPPFRKGGRLLDVGCGSGDRLLEFRRLGWNVTGLDISAEAARKGKLVGLDIFVGDLSEAPWPESSFDAITLYHVLEHVHTPTAYLERVAHLLAPGGVLLVAVPNFRSWERRLFRQQWAWLDVPIHLHHFEPERLRRLVESVGLRTSDVHITTAGHSAENSLCQTRLRRAYRFLDGLKLAKPALTAFQFLADACQAGSGITLIAQRPA